MSEFAHRIPADWKGLLRGLLEAARAKAPRAVLVFDLDSTVFDNRPRQARILRELGAERGLPKLEACQPHHWASGWDMKGALLALGLAEAEASALMKDARRFWGARFFTSEYCQDDVEVPGARAYLHAVLESGAQLAYVTGRPEVMRAGTVHCLRKCGMPLPGDRVDLVMKPAERESDDAFKEQAHPRLREKGEVLAAFDNEPLHANIYEKAFPRATVVHLATDHSGRPVTLHPRIVSVPHFDLGS